MNGDHEDVSKKPHPTTKINHEDFEELQKFIKACKNNHTKLSFEVEILDQNLPGDLLDVTIIGEEETGGTITLKLNEVEDFLEMISDVNEGNYQVYTTAFEGLKRKLPCLDPAEDQKPGAPCLCQHCGMVGVLVESAKRPAIPHTPNTKFIPQTASFRSEKRKIDLRSKSKSETNLILLRELGNKIALLEERLMNQEENMVRKDYFKFVIHKLLTQYTNKINELKEVLNKWESGKVVYPVRVEDKFQKNRNNIEDCFPKSPKNVRCKAKTFDEEQTTSNKRPSSKTNKNINISYVNPASKRWLEDPSETSTKSKDNKHTIEEKLRYLKVLAKRKNVDESILWKNILMQAKKHTKSNDDTVSIQLPSDDQKLSELELTLSNLKDIVKKSRCTKNVKSDSSTASKIIE